MGKFRNQNKYRLYFPLDINGITNSFNFRMRHLYQKQKRLLVLDHIDDCGIIYGCKMVRAYSTNLIILKLSAYCHDTAPMWNQCSLKYLTLINMLAVWLSQIKRFFYEVSLLHVILLQVEMLK